MSREMHLYYDVVADSVRKSAEVSLEDAFEAFSLAVEPSVWSLGIFCGLNFANSLLLLSYIS